MCSWYLLRQSATYLKLISYLILHLLAVLVDGSDGAHDAVHEALRCAVLIKGLEPEDLRAGLGVLGDLCPLCRRPEVRQLVILVHHIYLELGGAWKVTLWWLLLVCEGLQNFRSWFTENESRQVTWRGNNLLVSAAICYKGRLMSSLWLVNKVIIMPLIGQYEVSNIH